MLLEKNPELLKKIKFGEQRDMFCISSEDKDALHEIAEMVAEFYEDRTLLEEQIEKYAKY
jgi:hypothetical protein